ncbi:MAG TPA: hypothetical protein VEJ18_10950, partial [Planctomycetota bacterium]|nr:hypothetical protein [Planctomycetota bacterium]
GKEKEAYRTARGGKLKVPVRLVKQAEAKDAAKVTLKAEGLPGQGNQRPVQVKDVPLDVAKPEAEIEIDVSDKAPLGPLTFYLAGELQIGYTHEPERPKQVEADRKRVEAVGKEAAAEIKTAEAARQKAEAEAKKAREALEEARKKKTADGQTDAAIKVAEDRLKAAEEAQAKAAEAEKKAKDLAKDAAEWLKRLTDLAKKATDAAKERKVKVLVASLPLTVDIAASPLGIETPAQPPVVRAGEKSEVVLKLRRDFGFAEEFKLELTAPGPAKLAIADGAAVAKDAGEAKLAISAGKDAALGVHAVKFKASLKWNGKTIPFEQEFSIRIDKPEEKKPEEPKPTEKKPEEKPQEKKDEPKKDASKPDGKP